jgi:phage shock protein PspC (stress-responsive transcriptional regulator)
MNKVTTIHLNGNAYQLEESAYEALRNYLDNADRRLEGNPDKLEIIADIERAIADKFRALLGPHKTVVVSAEVETILAAMGPVQDPSAGSAEAPGGVEGASGSPGGRAGGSGHAPGGGATARRLYKIKDGRMIGGVCNGLAAYLNIDVSIVRVLFAFLVFCWGFGLLLYLLMLILIPAAVTPAEMAAATGGSPSTAEEFIRRAKEGYYEGMKSFKDKQAHREWKRKFRSEMREWKRNFRREMSDPSNRWGHRWVVYNRTHGVCRLLIAIVGIYAIYSLITQGSVFGVHLLPGMPLWLGILCVILLWKVACGLAHAFEGDLSYGPSSGGCGALWSLLSWLGIVFLIFWLGSHHEPRFQGAIHDAAASAHGALDSIRDGWNKR